MRFISLIAAAAAALSFAAAGAPTVAQAGDLSHVHQYVHSGAPRGWGKTQTVKRWVYRPHYRHVYRLHSRADPYRYQYKQPKYYPNHNSGYWRPRRVVRYRYDMTHPRYHRRWGCCGPNRKRKKVWVWHRNGHAGKRAGHHVGHAHRHR